jgi:hypothetical protein
VAVPADEREMAVRTLRAMPWVESVETVNDLLRITAPEDAGTAINRALVEQGIYASMIAPQRSSLEDLFLELTEEAETAAVPAATMVPGGERW